MTPTFSLYLDLIRFLAAMAVFLDHLSSHPFTRDIIWRPLSIYATGAVIVFFVLSGYVISYVSSTREMNAKDYFSARVARLYSVVGVCLMLTLIFDHLGIWLNPGFYSIRKILWKPESWKGYMSSALFLNEFQVFHFDGISPGTNGPYWSLSFEATYYVIAGLVLFFRRSLWIPISIIILACAGKTIAALLPIWALGFALYRVRPALRVPPWISLVLAVASAIAVLESPSITRHFSGDNFGVRFPWGRGPFNRRLLDDYFVAVAFATHLVCVRHLLSKPISIPERIGSGIRWLGSLTFPFYCFHYPTICLLAAISPWRDRTRSRLFFICICTIVLVIVTTPLCDWLKTVIRRSLSRGSVTNNRNRPDRTK